MTTARREQVCFDVTMSFIVSLVVFTARFSVATKRLLAETITTVPIGLKIDCYY